MSTFPDQPPFTTLAPRDRARLLKRIQADLDQMARCQGGEHLMEATRSAGLFVCARCRTVGVCLWCGLIPPDGACVSICPQHRQVVDAQARHSSETEAQP